MPNYFIQSFKITKLWGYREDINLTFNNDVNVLIGVNGSGKTTVLNLLNSILSLDISGILNVNFEYAEIHLRDFKDSSVLRTVKVDAANRLLRLRLDEKETNIDTTSITGHRFTEHRRQLGKGNTLPERLPERFVRRTIVPEKFYDELTSLVPIAWLPVDRRLPLTGGEEERYTRTKPLESVDLRLKELLDRLSRYYLILNAQFSERRREFEGQALSTMLYNKESDGFDSMLDSISSSPLPTKSEKTQLLNAFETTGFLDEKMQTQIDDYFTEAERVLKRISEGKRIRIKDIPILPIIRRTQTMVKSASKLEKHRKNIFALLRLYEETVNSFLEGKTIAVDQSDGLKIKLSSKSELNWRNLSSGEKQILILLTEILLKVDEPIVYIADEPELSLHVIWQEKLLESLVTLGGQKQIIVATHSPDIVGKFHDKVIDLGEGS